MLHEVCERYTHARMRVLMLTGLSFSYLLG
jgi:hypothetical protein